MNKTVHIISFVLVIVGGLNWGLVGLFGFNLVEVILGGIPMVERTVYVLVGLGAVYLAFNHKKDCRECVAGGGMQSHHSGTV